MWREWASWSFWRFWLRPRWGDWVPFWRSRTPTPLGRILYMDQSRLLAWNYWRMQDNFLPCWGGFWLKDFAFRWQRHLSRGLPLGTSDPRRQILSDLGWWNWIMGRLCRWRRRLVLLLPPGISDRSYIRSDYIRSMPTPSRAIFVWRPYGSLLVVGPSFSFGTARARWQSWAGRYFFDAIEVPRNLFFCCWESLPRNVSQSLEGVVSSIWLWRRGPLVITLWPWRRIDIKLR